MSTHEPTSKSPDVTTLEKLYRALDELITKVPDTGESTASDPMVRSRTIARDASVRAALISGGLALPPGPLGVATIIPDLIAIWKIQGQMVADIAGAYGKSALLNKEQMIYCLFRHAAAQVVRDLVTRIGERFLIRQVSLQVMQRILEKVSYKVSQRVLGRVISRWLPIAGAVAVGSYAFYDTNQVAKTAIEYFSKASLDMSDEEGKVVEVDAEVETLKQ